MPTTVIDIEVHSNVTLMCILLMNIFHILQYMLVADVPHYVKHV